MAGSTELLIARHGEAHCNVAGVVGGDKTCTGLSSRGRDQMARLAARLRTEHHTARPIDALYASPRQRVRESGQILADALALPLHIEPELVAPEHGDADGIAWDEAKSAFGGPPQAYPDRPHARGAETWNAYLTRATTLLTHLLERHAGQRILLAAHGETVEAAHTLMLDLPPGACTRLSFYTDHASLTRWERHTNRFGRTVWLLTAYNDTAHLTP
jgi:probable phosphoglycerate mutase